jgi:asparagine synthase (glutamine-hydrolysing)
MCGIVGFNSKNSKKLEDMIELINHRGDNDNGVFESELFSLGHTRLSIIDLSLHGHQPMQYERLSMVYNGEVYNFREIRDELISYGYEFLSDSDSEVVLKSLHMWGVDAINRFIGMFAIALYDTKSMEVTLIRDRVGVKPLYYYFDGADFVFGSELKPIIEYFRDKKSLEISKEALFEYFKVGYISSNLSIFKDCYKVPAGKYLTFKIEELKIEINEYWSILPFFKLPKFKKSEEELIDELEQILIDAFKYRMVSDVPVGLFLSGGVDSSIVAAILQKHYGNIHTFTIGFDEQRYNEAEYAKRVAKYLGTNHTEKYLSVESAKEILDRFVDIYDEPFGDSSGIPTTLVSQVAKESGVKVVLSADGGDELFCGYKRYWKIDSIGNRAFNLSPFSKKSINHISHLLSLVTTGELKFKFRYINKIINSKNWKRLYSNLTTYDTNNITNYMKNINDDSFCVGVKEHPMQGMMLWDYHRYMVDDILTKVDRATMSLSIEGREPLLDHRIAEFMAQVPFEFKYKNGESKYLLKKVLERYLPKEMIYREKSGFGIPIFEWFSSDLRELFSKYLHEDRLKKHNLLNIDLIKKELNSLNKKNIVTIWNILVFQMWYEKYIDRG